MYNDKIPTNENCIVGLNLGASNFRFINFTKNTKIYLENIFCINSGSGNIYVSNDTNFDVSIILNNCKLFNNFASNQSLDGFTNHGCNSICQNCLIAYSKKDGFNYAKTTNNYAKGIEINCKAIYNGDTNIEDLSSQGSTSHDGSKVLRINCLYGLSYNSNIVDTGSIDLPTVTTNYGLILFDAFDNVDVSINHEGTKAYFFNCYLKGSKSNLNFRAFDNSVIYLKDCVYDTKQR